MVLNEDPFRSVARPGTFSQYFVPHCPLKVCAQKWCGHASKGVIPVSLCFNVMFQILLQMLTLDICLVLTFCLSSMAALPF